MIGTIIPRRAILALDPCKGDYLAVRARYPQGVPLTVAACDRLVDDGVDVLWALTQLLTPDQRVEFARLATGSNGSWLYQEDIAYLRRDSLAANEWSPEPGTEAYPKLVRWVLPRLLRSEVLQAVARGARAGKGVAE